MQGTMRATLAMVAMLGLALGGCSDDDDPSVQVNSQFGSSSQFYIDGNYLGDVPANGSGKWDIPAGNHTFTASTSAVGVNGDVADGANVVFGIDGGGNLYVP
jgi:hypothetical protein